MLLKFENEKQKRARIEQWHNKFAWLPVKVDDGKYAWLEVVSRKAVYIPNEFANRKGGFLQFEHQLPKGEWLFSHWVFRRKPSRVAGSK